MKKVILTIVDFFKNLFTAKKPVAKTTVTQTERSKIEEEVEQELKDLFCKSDNFETKDISSEIQDVTTETEKVIIRNYPLTQVKTFKNIKNNEIVVNAKRYMLTDKQLFFYNQIKNSKDGLHGNKAAREFIYNISMGYSDEKFKAIPKSRFKIGAHKMTVQGLLKMGLVKEASKNFYVALK